MADNLARHNDGNRRFDQNEMMARVARLNTGPLAESRGVSGGVAIGAHRRENGAQGAPTAMKSESFFDDLHGPTIHRCVYCGANEPVQGSIEILDCFCYEDAEGNRVPRGEETPEHTMIIGVICEHCEPRAMAESAFLSLNSRNTKWVQ